MPIKSKKIFKNKNTHTQNGDALFFDFCPQVYTDFYSKDGTFSKDGGIIIHNKKRYLAKSLLKDRLLYSYMNYNSKGDKKTYLIQKIIYNKNKSLDSIIFSGITTKEFKKKKKLYKNSKKY
jgi:hypothetical protein